MNHLPAVIILLVLMAGCKKANSNQDVCNMGYYVNDTNTVEAVEVEPELIPVPLDTAVLKGSWKLVRYHSPYFNIIPTDKFDYIITFSGTVVEMKFAANELLSEYRLQGDTLRLGNGLMTKVYGGDIPLETAISELLRNNNLTVSCTVCPDLYLCLRANDEIIGNAYADFLKIK